MTTQYKKSINDLFFSLKEVVNFSPQKFFEVKPNRFSPLFIKIKTTLSDVKTRTEIARVLSQYIDSKVDCICGIESGGSYYASIVADKLKKPLILFRKHEKQYAEGGKIVGKIPFKNSTVAIIDDVVVSGLTLSPAINYLRDLGCKIKIFTIFSYGLDQYVEKRLKTKIISITNLNDLLSNGVLKGFFTKKDVDLISQFVYKQKSKLQQSLL